MSRVGLKPITIKESVEVTAEDGGNFGNVVVKVKGPKGELTRDVRKGITIEVDKEEKLVKVGRVSDSKSVRAFHGLYRALIQNMIDGVTDGFFKELEIHGVGYRAKMVGKNIELVLGWTHPVTFKVPEGIEAEITKDVDIKITGIDNILVGQTAAKIRDLKKPEPYKGKGIRYKGEYVRRKAGKTAIK